MKLGVWNMRAIPGKFLGSAAIGNLPASRIHEISATIRSDPNPDGKIQVDDFEHLSASGNEGTNTPYFKRKRGGLLFYGIGCTGSGTDCASGAAGSSGLRFFAGTNDGAPQHREDPPISQFRSTKTQIDPTASRDLAYTSTGVNRGWLKIGYTGSIANNLQPYFIRSKIAPIGSWNMQALDYKSIPLSSLGLTGLASRISGLTAILARDWSESGYTTLQGEVLAGVSTHNAYGPQLGSGRRHDQDFDAAFPQASGAAVFVDEAAKIDGQTVPSLIVARNFNPDDAHTGPDPRGYVRVDYLAAECNEGSGYNRFAVGSFSQNSNDCHGNTANGHVIQTKGQDISGTSDNFYFACKNFSTSTYTATLRVNQMENTSSTAKAGLMMRQWNSASNPVGTDPHVSIVVTPSGNVQFIRRTGVGAATSVTTFAVGRGPIWLKLFKNGNSFSGSYSRDGASWNQVGASVNISSMTAFRVGMAVASGAVGNYNTAGFTNVSF
jgi:hypothetical protein